MKCKSCKSTDVIYDSSSEMYYCKKCNKLYDKKSIILKESKVDNTEVKKGSMRVGKGANRKQECLIEYDEDEGYEINLLCIVIIFLLMFVPIFNIFTMILVSKSDIKKEYQKSVVCLFIQQILGIAILISAITLAYNKYQVDFNRRITTGLRNMIELVIPTMKEQSDMVRIPDLEPKADVEDMIKEKGKVKLNNTAKKIMRQ